MRALSVLRCSRRAVFSGLFLAIAAVGCDTAEIPDSELPPDVTATLAEGTGVSSPNEPTADPTQPQYAAMAFFEGYVDQAAGEMTIEMLPRETWERGIWDESEGRYRTTGQPIRDFCESDESRGELNTFKLDNIAGTFPTFNDDCPRVPGIDGNMYSYMPFGRAYCAQVRMRSNWQVPINNVYAELVRISDPADFAMYDSYYLENFGLGNGAEPPELGNNSPTDVNGGLIHYGDFPVRGHELDEWWVFRRASDSNFFFSGIIVYEALELDNDIDDDCDGQIDEDTQSYEDGDLCYTDNDCIGGKCDCGIAPCTTGQSPTCRTPYCGDGIVEGTEDCDPGAEGVDSTTCNFDCTAVVCGDGYHNATAGEACDPGAAGETSDCNFDCTISGCPDGILNAASGELCDDGNASNTDACLIDCTPATCGDAYTRIDLAPSHPDYEQCDDGNSVSTDGCIDCRIAGCGDGFVHAGAEECDGDGLGTGGETLSCDQDCTFAQCGDGTHNPTAGETCDEAGNASNCDIDCTTPVCGDALVNPEFTPAGASNGEQCDLGNATNNDVGSCTSLCQNARCGDGFRRTDITDENDPDYEACDDGAGNSFDPGACRPDCTEAICGDGVLDPGEVCDQGNLNSNVEPGACRLDCTYFRCGDDVVDPPNPITGAPAEVCDDGETDLDGDGKVNSDTLPDACRTNCSAPYCGDGVNDTGESCDDGNANNNDSCLTGCTPASCGDGRLWNSDGGTETCDDGNTIGGDGCNANCEQEAGWNCNPGSPCVSVCGDGIVRGSEACDDGNTTNSDGCSSTCQLETGWYCQDQPSDCNTICGDGVRAGLEYCDTGFDTTNCDAHDCSQPVCGDNHRNIARGEQCDDGNGSNSDACLNTCVSAVCGDGWVRSGFEECDGNNNGVGGMTATCDPPGAGAQGCTLAECGDGFRNTTAGEECDNGLANNNSTPNACRTNCTVPSCGDGVEDAGEQCDNGSSNSNSAPNACRTDCSDPVCGDGVTDTAFGEQCDGGPNCINCRIDNDGDGYLAPADCNDNDASINPGAMAAEQAGGLFDNIDQNCDGVGFPPNLTSTQRVFLVATSCAGLPSSFSGRCFTQLNGTTGLQNAINAADSNDVVVVRGTVTVSEPVELKNGVDIYGGWQANWLTHNTSVGAQSEIRYNTSDATNISFHATLFGANLTTTTILRYLYINTIGVRKNGDVTSVHGMSLANASGVSLRDSTIRAGNAFDGVNANQGVVQFGDTTNTRDCEWYGCDTTPNEGRGGGNGWRMYCPLSNHAAQFYAGNAALNGGGAGGSSIGLLLTNSSGITLERNRIYAGRGGAGGTANNRGGQGGHSVPLYMFGEKLTGWTIAGENGSPSDCSSIPNSNSLHTGTSGAGGAGLDSSGGQFSAGQRGFSATCHFQAHLYEWAYNCRRTSTTNLRSTDANEEDSTTLNPGRLAYRDERPHFDLHGFDAECSPL